MEVLLGGAFIAVYMLVWLVIGVGLNALLLRISIRIVCKRRYHLRDAFSVSLKVMLTLMVLQLIGMATNLAIPEEIQWVVAVIVALVGFIVSGVLYGKLIESRRGGGIGMKRGFLIQLMQTALCIALAVPFVVIGLIIGASAGNPSV